MKSMINFVVICNNLCDLNNDKKNMVVVIILMFIFIFILFGKG